MSRSDDFVVGTTRTEAIPNFYRQGHNNSIKSNQKVELQSRDFMTSMNKQRDWSEKKLELRALAIDAQYLCGMLLTRV